MFADYTKYGNTMSSLCKILYYSRYKTVSLRAKFDIQYVQYACTYLKRIFFSKSFQSG